MTEIITVNRKSLVYGLTWVTVNAAGRESAELAALTRDAGSGHYAKYVGNGVKIGLVKRNTKLPPMDGNGPPYSAALLFSYHQEHCAPGASSILVHQINATRVAIIVLLKGIPYLDIVVGADELEAQLKAIRGETPEQFLVTGNCSGHCAQLLTPETLLMGAIEGAMLKSHVPPWKKFHRPGLLALFLFTVAIIGAGAWYCYGRDSASSGSNVVKTPDPVALYEENISRLLATAGFDGEAAYKTLWQIIKNREIELDGWSLKSIKCKPTQCEELWQKGHGSFSSLKLKLPQWQTISLQANGQTSLISYPLTMTKAPLDRARLPAKADVWTELSTQQGRLKQIHPLLVFTPKMAEIRGLDPTIPAAAIPPSTIVYAGDMTISAPLGLAAEIFLHQMKNVMVNEVSIEALGDVKNARIQIGGRYYAKN